MNRNFHNIVASDERTYNLCCNEVSEKITSNTKVILPVHLYGRLCPIREFSEIAKDNHAHKNLHQSLFVFLVNAELS